jgi:Ca-activated chloride channel homolog
MAELTRFAQRVQWRASRHRREIICIQKRMQKRSTPALRCLIILGVLVLLHCIASAQEAMPPEQGRAQEEYTLKLHSDIVMLNATVVDRHNAPVSGLDKENFQIYEDGLPQQIRHFSSEDVPVTVGILIDNSGSMKPKRDDVITDALAFASSSNPRDQMFIVNFNEHVTLGLPAKIPFTDRREELQRALTGIRTVGQTALYDGIIAGLTHLQLGTRDKKVLILISDGGDNASNSHLTQVIEMAKQSSAIIYAIGIFDEDDDDRNPSVLKRLAKLTGGEAFFPESSKDIVSICEKIARDIRSQYTLVYVPNIATPDAKYRTVEVKASAPGHGRLTVRTRPGYFTSSVTSQPKGR